jgi:hypothetical protein
MLALLNFGNVRLRGHVRLRLVDGDKRAGAVEHGLVVGLAASELLSRRQPVR